jgi:hypothetical protein
MQNRTRKTIDAGMYTTIGVLMTLIIFASSTHAATTTTFSGRAFGLSVQAPLVSLSPLGDTGQLPPSGGEIDATPISAQTQYADAQVLLSVTMGSGSKAESQAAIANAVLLPGTTTQVTADFLMSESVATCTGTSGFSEIANLQVAGQPVTVTGQPNQVFSVPGVLTLVIDEQITTSDGITVNALDLTTVGGIQVIVASAESDITCAASTSSSSSTSVSTSTETSTVTSTATSTVTSTATSTSTITSTATSTSSTSASSTSTIQSPHDFVTGGGWIPVSGDKGSFGFVAGYKGHDTSPSGNLEYNDHGTGMKVKATSVLSYGGSDNIRTFSGDAEINGQPGFTYTVTVQDNGEPGAGQDTFSIQLSNGYSASGILGGGNIEIHAG